MFTCCTYVRNNSPLACRLVCIKMEIIVLMPNVPVPPPPSLSYSLYKSQPQTRGTKRFLLKIPRLNPVLCLGTPQAGLGEEGDRGELRCVPWCHTGWDREAAAGKGRHGPAPGRGSGALGFSGSRCSGCPGDGAVFLWPLPPVPLTSQSV